MMRTVVSTVAKTRFEKYGVSFPADWNVCYVPALYEQEDLIKACTEADYLFVGSMDTVTAQVIKACPQLKMIHTEGSGYDKVDINAAKAAGIPVCHNFGVNNGAVAEHAIALMLTVLRRIALCDAEIRTEGYAACQAEHRTAGEHELFGKHIGLIGIGAIGKEVVKRLSGWGCRISYYDPFRPSPDVEQALGVDYLAFDELVSQCDVVSLHVPMLPGTYHILGTQQFAAMKKTAIVINCARGEILDQKALAEALENGEIAGAGVDTLEPEPAPSDHPLIALSPAARNRLVLTPHSAGTTDEAFTRMLKNAISNFQRLENGEKPLHVVNDVM